LAYFFCDYRDTETLVPVNILQSLIKQLAIQNEDTFQEVETFWEQHTPEAKRMAFEVEEESQGLTSRTARLLNDDHSRSKALSEEEHFVRLLQRMSMCFEQVMILVDGLDESGEQRAIVASLLSRLADAEVGKIKTILASRDEYEIRFQLSTHNKISIAAKSSDVRLYVERLFSRDVQERAKANLTVRLPSEFNRDDFVYDLIRTKKDP
jgi:hypothetical protein